MSSLISSTIKKANYRHTRVSRLIIQIIPLTVLVLSLSITFGSKISIKHRHASIHRRSFSHGEIISFVPKSSSRFPLSPLSIEEIFFFPSPICLDETFTVDHAIDDESFCSLLNDKGFTVHVLSVPASYPLATSFPTLYQNLLSETLKWRVEMGVNSNKIAVIAHELSTLYLLDYLGLRLLSTCTSIDTLHPSLSSSATRNIKPSTIGSFIVIDPPPILSLLDNGGNILNKYVDAMESPDKFWNCMNDGGEKSLFQREKKFHRYLERVNANRSLRVILQGTNARNKHEGDVNYKDAIVSVECDGVGQESISGNGWKDEVDLINQCLLEEGSKATTETSLTLTQSSRKKKKKMSTRMNWIPLSGLSPPSNLQTAASKKRNMNAKGNDGSNSVESNKLISDKDFHFTPLPDSFLLGDFPHGLALIREFMKGRILIMSTYQESKQQKCADIGKEDILSVNEACTLTGGEKVSTLGWTRKEDGSSAEVEEKSDRSLSGTLEDETWGEHDKRNHAWIATEIALWLRTLK